MSFSWNIRSFKNISRSIGVTSRYFLENDHGKVAIYEAKMEELDSVSLPDGCFWTILSAAKKNFIWTGDEHGVIFPTCEEILIIGKNNPSG